MNDAPNVLFDSTLWKTALQKYAESIHLTVELFGADMRMMFGPIHPTPFFELFEGGGYDPGLFSECARRCIIQTENRPAVMVSQVHGLAVIGTSLVLDGKVVGAAVAGYAFVDFSQFADARMMARESGVNFERLWRVAREQKPVSRDRLMVLGELLQVLGDALLRENHRTRQHEQAAEDLENIVKERTASVRELTSKLLRARDEEGRRIARELHDSVAQYLSNAKISLELFLERPDTTGEGMQNLANAANSLDACFMEIRTISHLLHPPLLDELGLASAMESFAKGFANRSGVEVSLHIPRKLKRLPADIELAVFRILQESLANAFRHSRTPSVDVCLRAGADQVVLEVRDYGRGITPETLERFRSAGDAGGVGLSSMRERVEYFGGRLEIRSDATGTIVRAAVPTSTTEVNEAMAAGNHTGR